MPSARRLVELGTPPDLATELAAQFAANVGNPRRLQELGMVGGAAVEIRDQLATTSNVRRLIERGIVPDLAREIASQIDE